MSFLPTVSLSAFQPVSLSGEAAQLHAPGTLGQHPLRRRTDAKDVIDVEVRELELDPLERLHAQQAYADVADLAHPVYRPGLVVNLSA